MTARLARKSLYNVGGDQDQVQLNIGMRCTLEWGNYVRVGIGFMIGRQEKPKMPAFHIFQTFLGLRPPLPFRTAFGQCIAKNALTIEFPPSVLSADQVLSILETYTVPADQAKIFVFIGKLWGVDEASTKHSADYRRILLELMPFYQELILAGGRYRFL